MGSDLARLTGRSGEVVPAPTEAPGPGPLARLSGYLQDRVARAGQMTQGPFHAPGGIDQAAGGTTGVIGTMTMPEDVAGPLGRGLSRWLNADPAAMTPSELNKTRAALEAEQSRLTTQLIDAGRGSERIQDIMRQSDPLSQQFRRVTEALGRLGSERGLRYGPGAPVTLPPGFPPRRRVP